eukprot:gene36217-8018_t
MWVARSRRAVLLLCTAATVWSAAAQHNEQLPADWAMV